MSIRHLLPRVLILYTGGTFGMDLLPDLHRGGMVLAVPHLSAQILKKRLQAQVPELRRIARCDVDIILNRDSAHIGPEQWLLFAKKITQAWNDYDGIVILHGTDTLAYTASALSFLLRPCLKPIVLTGAQRPLSEIRTDARTNLISAVEIAAHGPRKVVKRVTVFFGDQLFQGNRVRKISATHFDAFNSPNFDPLARIGTSIEYSEQLFVEEKIQKSLKIRKPDFNPRVLLAHVTPAFPSQALTAGMLSHLDALVLVVFHSVTAPTHDPSFMLFLKAARERKIPIILATEGSRTQRKSKSQPVTYAAGKELFDEGCVWAGTMTPECAFVKTSFLLPQIKGLKAFHTAWAQELAEEGG